MIFSCRGLIVFVCVYVSCFKMLQNCDFTDLFDACSSDPCTFGQTDQCVSLQSQFVCICTAGYAGVHCQTDINECASNPCMHGGTCVDGINGFACICNGWEGAVCDVDINECVRYNYGGCSRDNSTCINVPGNYSCVSFDGHLTSAGGLSTDGTGSFVVGSTAPQNITFQIRTEPYVFANLTNNYWQFMVMNDIVPPELEVVSARRRCLSVYYASPHAPNDPIHNLTCVTPQWYDIGVRMIMRSVTPVSQPLATNFIAFSADTFAYPVPTILPNTIRTGFAGFGQASDNPTRGQIMFPDAASYPIVFDVTNPAPSDLPIAHRIAYGPNSNRQRFKCDFVDATPDSITNSSVPRSIRCSTAVASTGSSLKFRYFAGKQSADGEDFISIPLIPYIVNITGCPESFVAEAENQTTQIGTAGCDTRGGDIITLYGINFEQPPELIVTVDGAACTNVTTFPEGDRATCKLPAGVGRSVAVTAKSTGTSPVARLISYATPNITRLIGCSVTVSALPTLSVTECDRFGTSPITVIGSNFGASGAYVLLGVDIIPAVHDSSSPHTTLSFVAPSGNGLDIAVLVLQSTFDTATSRAVMSYRECPPGTHQSKTDPGCIQCEGGKYSKISDAADCDECAAGFYSESEIGSRDCFKCKRGSGALSGQSTCLQCEAGSAQPNEGQLRCEACLPGTYSNIPAAENCTVCSKDSATPKTGSTACETCVGIRTQSGTGQKECDTCLFGNFYNAATAQCLPCPPQVICNSTGIYPVGNYYVYYSASQSMSVLA